jgi:hypothetical protein
MRLQLAVAIFFSVLISAAHGEFVEGLLQRAIGVRESSPNSTFTNLAYTRCDTGTDQFALIRFDIIGNGANQVPPGSTITLAHLRLRAQIGGDGNMWRCTDPWTTSSTWNSLGGDNLGTLGPAE